MTRVAIIGLEGQIEQLYTAGSNVDPEGPWSGDNQKTVVHLEAGIDPIVYKKLRYYKDGAWKERIECPGTYYDWKDEAWVLSSTRLWEEIRNDRNKRLYDSDWTQVADAPLTDEQTADWAAYRTGLRNIPSQNSEVIHLNEVIWPEQPS